MTPVEYRRAIYDVFATPGDPVESKIDRALEIGVDYLDLSIGFFTRIGGGIQEFVRVTGDHPAILPGETCPLEEAYCRRTIELESPLAIQDAAVSAEISAAAVEAFDLGAYIGARVIVDDETYGTICFADEDTKDGDFTEAESFFVELLARLLGQALEREGYEADMAVQTGTANTKAEGYRAVVDSSFDLVFQIDDGGRFTFVSATVEDLLGYTPETYVEESFTSMLPSDAVVDLAQELYDEVMGGRTVEERYFPLEHRTDGRILVDLRITPVYSGDVPPEDRTPDDIVGVQGMARNAMGRQRRERLIRVLNRVLRHNLRNDMNVISGYAAVLHDRLSAEDARDEEARYAAKILETSERLVTLGETARKLEVNLDSTPERSPTDVVPVLERAADQIAERYPAASITVDSPASAVARGAPRLETALWELLDNAAKHTGPEPSITVSVLEPGGSQVVIRISDDGPGLPDQERAVLVSGEETPLIHGSGLGLFLVYWIVESLQGQLTVRERNGGTSVEIALDSAREP